MLLKLSATPPVAFTSRDAVGSPGSQGETRILNSLLSCYLHDAASGVQLFPPVPFPLFSQFPIGTTGLISLFVLFLFHLLAWPDLPDVCAPLF